MKRFCRSILYLMAMSALSACNRMPATASDETFDYREIYLPYSFMCDEKELNLNNVERDWGIWGHNLDVVIPERHVNSIYASVGGTVYKKQFCFSSPQLLLYISKYIDENFGNKKPQRFAILPNDNDLVCQCGRCREAGCTPTDASPAVFALLEKLAKLYPKHTFFTSYYLTTKQLPKAPLPDNVGVLVSAMDYRLSPVETPEEQQFAKLLSDWHEMCRHVYVWDYINNFDDYYTPFPVYTVMQRRLQLYARSGVKGVFLNGSGHDYSTYNRINTYVLAELLKSPDVNWREVLMETCRHLFPVAGETLALFRIDQEEYVAANGRALPIYDGVAAALKTYLPKESFLNFYSKMERLSTLTTGSEQRDVTRVRARHTHCWHASTASTTSPPSRWATRHGRCASTASRTGQWTAISRTTGRCSTSAANRRATSCSTNRSRRSHAWMRTITTSASSPTAWPDCRTTTTAAICSPQRVPRSISHCLWAIATTVCGWA